VIDRECPGVSTDTIPPGVAVWSVALASCRYNNQVTGMATVSPHCRRQRKELGELAVVGWRRRHFVILTEDAAYDGVLLLW
jgi:hypothetical protein